MTLWMQVDSASAALSTLPRSTAAAHCVRASAACLIICYGPDRLVGGRTSRRAGVQAGLRVSVSWGGGEGRLRPLRLETLTLMYPQAAKPHDVATRRSRATSPHLWCTSRSFLSPWSCEGLAPSLSAALTPTFEPRKLARRGRSPGRTRKDQLLEPLDFIRAGRTTPCATTPTLSTSFSTASSLSNLLSGDRGREREREREDREGGRKREKEGREGKERRGTEWDGRGG
jgi:hypothetical protein